MKKRRMYVFIILAIILLLVIAAAFYFLFYTRTCENEYCFLNSLKNCEKTKYTVNKEGNIWEYKILNSFSFSRNVCNVNVKNIQIASEDVVVKRLEGKEMICKIPKDYAGSYIGVHQKLEFCSGELKEDLQDIIINKMYKNIIQNIGEISQEVQSWRSF